MVSRVYTRQFATYLHYVQYILSVATARLLLYTLVYYSIIIITKLHNHFLLIDSS